MKLLFLAFSVLALSSTQAYAEETPFFGEINAKQINLRSDATTSATVISALNKGERIEVVSESYDWYKIRLPKNIPVYMKKNLAACIKYADSQMAGPSSIERCLSAKILGDRVNIRIKPSESAPIVGIADKDEIVDVVSESGGWYKIEPIQNSFGWVHKKFVDKVVSQNKTSIPQENPDNLMVFTGIVQPYGIVFMRPATHKLITPDHKTFLLKGNRASLDALNRQKVKVVGSIINGLKVKYPVIEVKIIEVAG
ncbi:MAG: SH3 domain-containing protein [Candidatus Omnitrophota bacterium]|nr:SH3 domain-containing protein [Candidatus Omnitrophota bacterium]